MPLRYGEHNSATAGHIRLKDEKLGLELALGVCAPNHETPIVGGVKWETVKSIYLTLSPDAPNDQMLQVVAFWDAPTDLVGSLTPQSCPGEEISDVRLHMNGPRSWCTLDGKRIKLRGARLLASADEVTELEIEYLDGMGVASVRGVFWPRDEPIGGIPPFQEEQHND